MAVNSVKFKNPNTATREVICLSMYMQGQICVSYHVSSIGSLPRHLWHQSDARFGWRGVTRPCFQNIRCGMSFVSKVRYRERVYASRTVRGKPFYEQHV